MALDKNIKINISLKDSATKGVTENRQAIEQLKTSADAAKLALMAMSAGIVAAFGLSIKSTLEYTEQIDIMAKSSGIAYEEIQRLGYAAKQEGGSMESLSAAMRYLNRNIYDASNGVGEAQGAFEALGISLKDSSGKLKTADTVFYEVIEAMEGIGDSTLKTSVAMDIFGRGGAELIPFFQLGKTEIKNLGDEAERMGKVLDEAAVKQGKLAGDEMLKLKTAFEGVQMKIAKEFLPILIEMSGGMAEFLGNVKSVIPLLQQATSVLVAFGAAKIGDAVSGLAQKFNGLAGAMQSSVTSAGAMPLTFALAAKGAYDLGSMVYYAVKALQALNDVQKASESTRMGAEEAAKALDKVGELLRNKTFSPAEFAASVTRDDAITMIKNIVKVRLDEEAAFSSLSKEEIGYLTLLEDELRLKYDINKLSKNTEETVINTSGNINTNIGLTREWKAAMEEVSLATPDLSVVGKDVTASMNKITADAQFYQGIVSSITRPLSDELNSLFTTGEFNLNRFMESTFANLSRFVAEFIAKVLVAKALLAALAPELVGVAGFLPSIPSFISGFSGGTSAPVGSASAANITIISPIEDGSFWRNRTQAYIGEQVNRYNIRNTRTVALA